MSDIGILNSPGDIALVVLILGWPVMFAAALIGAIGGWFIRRHRNPWGGLAAGLLGGLVVGAAGVTAYLALAA